MISATGVVSVLLLVDIVEWEGEGRRGKCLLWKELASHEHAFEVGYSQRGLLVAALERLWSSICAATAKIKSDSFYDIFCYELSFRFNFFWLSESEIARNTGMYLSYRII